MNSETNEGNVHCAFLFAFGSKVQEAMQFVALSVIRWGCPVIESVQSFNTDFKGDLWGSPELANGRPVLGSGFSI